VDASALQSTNPGSIREMFYTNFLKDACSVSDLEYNPAVLIQLTVIETEMAKITGKSILVTPKLK